MSGTSREEAMQRQKEHLVTVLMSQTTLTEDDARSRLEENGYNVQKCIRVFMGMPAEEKTTCGVGSASGKTVNQSIYGNIRSMMDEASFRYERRKEMEARIEMAKEAYLRSNVSEAGGGAEVSESNGDDE